MLAHPSDSQRLSRRYEVHLPGLLYIGVTVILGVGAINSQNNLLFVVFGVALGALLFSGLMSGAMLMGVSVERRSVAPGAVGEALRLTYTLRNTNRIVPAFAISITEGAPGRGVARWQRWTRLIERPRLFVAEVGARGAVTVHAEVMGLARGTARLETIVLSSGFPFGIFRKSVRFAQPEQLVVTPEIRTLAGEVFRTVETHARFADLAASRRGRGDEFYGLRDYVRGDSPRQIAWKASARSGTLVTRLTAEHSASELRLLLLLEGGGDEDANERAITFAASMIDGAWRRGMSAGLWAPQVGLSLAPAHTPVHRQTLLTALAMIDLGGVGDGAARDVPSAFGASGANAAVAPTGGRHPLAPADVPVFADEALERWAENAPPAPSRPKGDGA